MEQQQIIQANMLYRTNVLLPGATLLLVDMERQYIEETYENMGLLPDEYWHDAHLDLMVRVGRIYRNLEAVKGQGHRIFATHNHPLIHGFDDLIDEHLPPWDHFSFRADPRDADSFHANLVRPLRHESLILVCGLWLERCVYQLTMQLRYYGLHAVILAHPNFSLEARLIGDSWSVEQRADSEGMLVLDYP